MLGVSSTKMCACTDKEIEGSTFMKHVEATTELLPDNRLQVRIPWKESYPEMLPNNSEKAVRQLERRERQLKRDNELEEYNSEVQALVDRSVVKIVNVDLSKVEESAWYLNHRSVKTPEKESTKVRIVFDSAAEYKGYSLNSAIESGPNLMNSLFTCLIAW